ncbi:MAG: hypothetical protein ACYS3S_26380, partial [Planctomycetota bacterium]
MSNFVAYLDILGTSSKIINEQFSDALMLDFSSPVALAAIRHSKCRFAVFSDCVILSCPGAKPYEFLEVIGNMYLSWCADAIFVRGGIALGEIKWVDFYSDKKEFNKQENFSHARVYGKALVEAYRLEQSSGPGALPFVGNEAAERLEKVIPSSIYRGQNNVLKFL